MEKGRDRGLHRLNYLCPIEKTIMCEVIAMAETIIGNLNYLSKSENLRTYRNSVKLE